MFKALILSAAAAIVAAPSVPIGPGTRFYDGDPPARYVKEGMALIVFVAPSRMNAVCGADNPQGLVLLACVRRLKDGNVPVVFMPHPAAFPGNPYARILGHELAHSIGNWPGDHPL